MKAHPVTPWIVRPRPNPQARLRVLCFPYAGGGASVFRTWPGALPSDVEVLAVELPGRETRPRDRLVDRRSALIAALADAIVPELEAPFAIYGHSMGAALGFSLARELRRRSCRAPAHLFVSGRRAPQLADPSPMYHLPQPEFIAQLRQLGGIPDAVFQETELMAYFLPILRADIGLVEAEPYVDEPPLGCPITALGGVSDHKASRDELDAWQAQTSASFACETFPGGHFFIQTARAAFLASLSRGLAGITAAR